MSDSPPPRSRFLAARWCHLILANYPVPDDLVRPHLPPGVELDRRDGSAWCSLVGFQFLDTRVLGVGWPGFRHFPEWNLRFYVRRGEERGVCFVREFVPQWLVATLARVIYNEPYRAARMTMDVRHAPAAVTARYTVAWGGRTHALRAVGAKPAVRPGPDGPEHWFKEHSWGYGTGRRGGLVRYQVSHPEWDVYPVTEFAADVDWGVLYGPAWAAMTGRSPATVVLAAGSAVSVYPKD
ncbi:MAG TPA: DUF2071 domain-containing protein [Urbifossiella sp.]|jgi:hypothetical protein|nr:DUF2071 domain-containing protein [Urbifossiella sp.]